MIFRRTARISWICAGPPLGGASGAAPGALRAPGRGIRRRSKNSARTSQSLRLRCMFFLECCPSSSLPALGLDPLRSRRPGDRSATSCQRRCNCRCLSPPPPLLALCSASFVLLCGFFAGQHSLPRAGTRQPCCQGGDQRRPKSATSLGRAAMVCSGGPSLRTSSRRVWHVSSSLAVFGRSWPGLFRAVVPAPARCGSGRTVKLSGGVAI